MSTGGDFPFAFGEGAAEQFKERLKELMRAQQEAFEEVQAEQHPIRVTSGAGMMPDRFNLIQQAVVLASSGIGSLEPQRSKEDAAEAMAFLFVHALAAVERAMQQR
jgi:hypothetical protein